MLFGTFIRILTSLIRDFCTSDRNFASTFFQIPSHDGHPWSWLVVGHCDNNPHNRLSLSRYMPCPAYRKRNLNWPSSSFYTYKREYIKLDRDKSTFKSHRDFNYITYHTLKNQLTVKRQSWTSHHWSDEILGNRFLSKPFLPSYPRSPCGYFCC